MLTGSICLSDIPQEYIFTSEKTGKKYLKIQIKEKTNGADQYGNSHYVEVDTYKDGSRAEQKFYLGNLKTINIGGASAQPTPQVSMPQPMAQPSVQPKQDDGLPF